MSNHGQITIDNYYYLSKQIYFCSFLERMEHSPSRFCFKASADLPLQFIYKLNEMVWFEWPLFWKEKRKEKPYSSFSCAALIVMLWSQDMRRKHEIITKQLPEKANISPELLQKPLNPENFTKKLLKLCFCRRKMI